LFLGQPAAALTHLEQISPAFDAKTTELLIAAFGEDPAAAGSSVLAWARWFCGDQDGATAAITTAVNRAGALGHPLTETYVHAVAALLAQMRDDPDAALRHATAAVTIATQHGIPVFDALASTALAWATGRLGLGDGLRLQQDALAGMARTGTAVTLTAAQATLAELVAAAGDPTTALATLDEALKVVEHTGERYYEPELYRLKAKLLATRGQTAQAADAAAAAVSAAETQGSVPFAARARRLQSRLIQRPR
jgi:adenylate cyclase